jgi:hypothetical protein
VIDLLRTLAAAVSLSFDSAIGSLLDWLTRSYADAAVPGGGSQPALLAGVLPIGMLVIRFHQAAALSSGELDERVMYIGINHKVLIGVAAIGSVIGGLARATPIFNLTSSQPGAM